MDPNSVTTTMKDKDTAARRGDEVPECKVWFVTGCSRGLGRNIVTAALARGDKVIATCRSISDLNYVKDNASVKVLSLDVSTTQNNLDKAVQEAICAFGVIDILVNNAGYVLSGPWEQLRYALNPIH